MKVDSDRLRALLAEHSLEPGDLGRFREGEMGEFLDEVRILATDADPKIRRQTCDALDLIVAEGDRDHFYGLLIEHLDKTQCRTLLTDTDPQVRTRVCWVTSWDRRNRGPVDVALDVLADERFEYAWPECIEVLRRPIEFDLLVGALVDAPSEGLSERLLGHARTAWRHSYA